MIRLFLGNRVGVLLLLPFLVIAFHYIHWVTGNHLDHLSDFGLWGELSFSPLSSYVWSGVFILTNAILLNYLYNSHQFLDKNSYLTSLLYLVTMTYYDAFYHFDYVLCVHFLFIMLLTQFFELKQQVDGRKYVFNAFVFIGIASTLQPLLLFFIPFFIFSLLIFRPFSFREFTLATIGFIVPFVYCFTYLWWYTIERNIFMEIHFLNSEFSDFIWSLLVYGVLIVVSYLSMRSILQKSSIRLKKQIQVLWLLVLMGMFIGILNLIWKRELNDLSFAMLFLTSLLTYSFLHKTYGLITAGVFYICLAYSMLKFFI
ncbi:MAG TPA: hypothetical protein DEF82_01740 [Crocinitomicaceae bacterium]|nr:hypothetical protein [Flavobacteriales bacterium]HBW85493.1 hypothetical protein [Crocinitomicaceae bacterium]